MKTGLCGVVVLLWAGVVSGEEAKTVTISHEGAPVMTIRTPKSVQVMTVIETEDMVLDLWVVPSAKTVAEAVAGLDGVIKNEVLRFAATSTETITVAGAEAKHLMGRGVEAEEEDPATVDIVVFQVGKTVLVACVHGEGDTAVRQRQPMLEALKTVKLP